MSKPKKLNTLQDLTEDLLRNYELVKSGKMEIPQARALLDTADKVIQGVRTQMAYNAMVQSTDPIPMMGGEKLLPPTSKAKQRGKKQV